MTMKFSRIIIDPLSFPRFAKVFIVVSLDIALCIISTWFAYYLRLGEFPILSDADISAPAISVIIALPIFFFCGLYRAIFRYSGWPALISVLQAVTIYSLLYTSIITAYGIQDIPRTIGIIQPIVLLLLVGASRALARLWLGDHYLRILNKIDRPKALIYGAGASGRELANALSNSNEIQVVGFLDDDDRLHGHILNGLPIHSSSDLRKLRNTQNIKNVLLAMPSVSRKRRNSILKKISEAKVAVRTLPSVSELARGKVTISDLHELDIDDLLGREPVAPNEALLRENISDKTILVSGAGGSIGSEICRQVITLEPKKVLLLEQNEYSLYSIHQELQAKEPNVSLVPLLASVQDNIRLKEIMSTWRPETVYHAAAYKHVPLVEHNLSEGIKNNVFGTLKMAQAAMAEDVRNFVLVSTDKAVRPTNIMGASKRLAEIILQALSIQKTSSKFSIVRFGNVLESSGSVVPKFRQQINKGGPVTITHPDITRFFMTIPEAAQLVIQASAMAKGGDVFVLDMGEPVKILKLARRMIELSGLVVKEANNPNGDIEIKITGLRPGEKLYEELLIKDNPQRTSHERIMKAKEDFIDWERLERELNSLRVALDTNDVHFMQTHINNLVPDYKPSKNIVDWVYMETN